MINVSEPLNATMNVQNGRRVRRNGRFGQKPRIEKLKEAITSPAYIDRLIGLRRELKYLSREMGVRRPKLILDSRLRWLGDFNSNTYKISIRDTSPAIMLHTLLHEIWHVVQHRKGRLRSYERSQLHVIALEEEAYNFADRQFRRLYSSFGTYKTPRGWQSYYISRYYYLPREDWYGT